MGILAGSQKKTYSKDIEQLAKQQGFSSAEQMYSFLRQRETPTGGTTSRGKKTPSLDAAMSWHPASIFNKISETLREAVD